MKRKATSKTLYLKSALRSRLKLCGKLKNRNEFLRLSVYSRTRTCLGGKCIGIMSERTFCPTSRERTRRMAGKWYWQYKNVFFVTTEFMMLSVLHNRLSEHADDKFLRVFRNYLILCFALKPGSFAFIIRHSLTSRHNSSMQSCRLRRELAQSAWQRFRH